MNFENSGQNDKNQYSSADEGIIIIPKHTRELTSFDAQVLGSEYDPSAPFYVMTARSDELQDKSAIYEQERLDEYMKVKGL